MTERGKTVGGEGGRFLLTWKRSVVAGDGAGNQYIRGEEEETKIRPEGGKVPAAVLAGEKGAAERERGRGEVLVGGAVWVPSVFWPKSEHRRWGECWLFE